ncbi:TAT-variant-translocated molybdopterin oxidoreductase [Isosphaeraceae bacterium EP7]
MNIVTNPDETLDLDAVRARLAGVKGQAYWRCLDELADAPAFAETLRREFPDRADEWADGTSRRQYLRVMGASIALAGFSGCGFGNNRTEKLVPPVRQPESVIPGAAQYFASSLTLGGYATGVLVESHEGRPIKVEGNDQHPASLGATDLFSQASVLSLYDPERSQVVLRESAISTLPNFLSDLGRALEAQKPSKGAGIRLLTETIGSPTLASQIKAFLDLYPAAKWVQYEPAYRASERAAAILAFGEDVESRYDLSKADVILALDADFLGQGPAALRYSRQYAERRTPSAKMSRLYAVESTPTGVGAVSDHRLALKPSLIDALARAVAAGLGIEGVQPGPAAAVEDHAAWVTALVKDLKAHKGSSLIIPGPGLPPAVHALAHAMNDALGNVGSTVTYAEPVAARSDDQAAGLRDLTREMDAKAVDLLVILGGNPAYTAPADIPFAAALRKVRRAVHLSLEEDETSELCRWHVNASHELESWGDARAFDGTASIVQPLIAPLYDGISPFDFLAALLGRSAVTGRDAVREFWKGKKLGGEAFEPAWERAVHDGLIADSATPAKAVTLKAEAAKVAATSGAVDSLEIVFRPDPTIWDGRFANNGWLQELPKPLTKITWDNAALMSPATAGRLGLKNEEQAELTYRGRKVTAPVWITPGHADGCVTVHLGYGRRKVGKVGEGAGFNAYSLQTSDSPHTSPGLEVKGTGTTYPIACTQTHRGLSGRDLLRTGTITEYLAKPDFARRHADEMPADESMFAPYPYEGNAWGLTIDLNRCTGCNACILGCVSENNIPVVGKDQVMTGREMHWIEIDRYYTGEDADVPESTEFQPRMCMHCENAPCELVCPVAATSHSAEGLNEMTYNRCVGTRYCGNNCPYKVRHFNFLEYNPPRPSSLTILSNPDVTVRSRGVMEKCTYCVQRINGARILAKEDGREIRDGEVVTACQAACPTRAITFGNINDKTSEVAKLKADPRSYGMLAELNTRPRTSYLARVRNPNTEITPEAGHDHPTHLG